MTYLAVIEIPLTASRDGLIQERVEILRVLARLANIIPGPDPEPRLVVVTMGSEEKERIEDLKELAAEYSTILARLGAMA